MILRDAGHALASPAGDVRHQHMAAEMQFRLDQDPPAARAAAASVERPPEVEMDR